MKRKNVNSEKKKAGFFSKVLRNCKVKGRTLLFQENNVRNATVILFEKF